MTNKKRAFLNNIQVIVKDYRKNPAESDEINKQLGVKYFERRFKITPSVMKEGVWLLRNHLKEIPDIYILDGKYGHFVHCIITFRGGSVLFADNNGKCEFYNSSKKLYTFNSEFMCRKEFLMHIREVKKILESK